MLDWWWPMVVLTNCWKTIHGYSVWNVSLLMVRPCWWTKVGGWWFMVSKGVIYSCRIMLNGQGLTTMNGCQRLMVQTSWCCSDEHLVAIYCFLMLLHYHWGTGAEECWPYQRLQPGSWWLPVVENDSGYIDAWKNSHFLWHFDMMDHRPVGCWSLSIHQPVLITITNHHQESLIVINHHQQSVVIIGIMVELSVFNL